jgi:tetratricopeptide (TPR) repeat protein
VLRANGDAPNALISNDAALERFRKAGDSGGLARAQRRRVARLWESGRFDEAQDALSEAMRVYREADDRRGVSQCLEWAGHLAYWRGEFDDAYQAFEESRTLAEQNGDVRQLGRAFAALAYVAFHGLRDPAAAAELCRRSIELFEELGNRYLAALQQVNLCAFEERGSNFDAARIALREAVDYFFAARNWEGLAGALTNAAQLAAALEKDQRAARLIGFTEALRGGTKGSFREAENEEDYLGALRSKLGDEQYRGLVDQGRTMTPEAAIEEAHLV